MRVISLGLVLAALGASASHASDAPRSTDDGVSSRVASPSVEHEAAPFTPLRQVLALGTSEIWVSGEPVDTPAVQVTITDSLLQVNAASIDIFPRPTPLDAESIARYNRFPRFVELVAAGMPAPRAVERYQKELEGVRNQTRAAFASGGHEAAESVLRQSGLLEVVAVEGPGRFMLRRKGGAVRSEFDARTTPQELPRQEQRQIRLGAATRLVTRIESTLRDGERHVFFIAPNLAMTTWSGSEAEAVSAQLRKVLLAAAGDPIPAGPLSDADPCVRLILERKQQK